MPGKFCLDDGHDTGLFVTERGRMLPEVADIYMLITFDAVASGK